MTAEEAQNAIASLNDVEVDGRRLLVREDREGPEGPAPGSKPPSAVPRGGGRGGSVRGRGGRGGGPSPRMASAGAGEVRSRAPASENAVYVGNLPWSISWQGLKDLFAPYGATYAGEWWMWARVRAGARARVVCVCLCPPPPQN